MILKPPFAYLKPVLLCAVLWTVAFSVSVSAQSRKEAVTKFISLIKDRTRNACVALDDPDGTHIISHNTREMMIPASILKVPLMNAAMDFLKGGYRFYTEFYTDEDDNLLIKGYGDPYLVSEEISIIARKLTAQGYSSFKSISTDVSAFKEERHTFLLGSDNPYDAHNGALVVNFNTVNVGRNPSGQVYSGEPQTPLTATAIKLGQTLSPGTLERFNTGKDKLIHESYVVELFSEVFARNGIRITGTSEAKPGRSKLKLILTHENTRTLRDVAKGLMEYSNNFIANQVMTVIGGEYNGYPTDLQTGLRVFRRINQEIFPDLEGQYAFYEGSGLSRDNRVTCNYMMRVLYAYRNYYETMPFRSGAYVKTGTLTGINNIAGYIPHEGRLYPFVMILYTNDDERFRFVGIMKNLLLL